MERRGGGIAGAGPEAFARVGIVKETGALDSGDGEDDPTRRAPSNDEEGAGAAARSVASSRQPDQDGLDGGSESMFP